MNSLINYSKNSNLKKNRDKVSTQIKITEFLICC